MLILVCGLALTIVTVGVFVAIHPVAVGRLPAELPPGTLGWRMQQIRLAHGWSLMSLSDRTGLTGGYLSQMETGRKTSPTLSVLETLAGVYGISVSELLVWTPNQAQTMALIERLRADVDSYRFRGVTDLPSHFEALNGLLDALDKLLSGGRST
ncbi:MAG TPA: helix-turn-helix transcriptional regulator [Symbiobacteriaceae bacterium]|jgi:transcriptional regulator with XRE-family HTH domain